MQRSVSWAAAPAQSTGQRPIKAFKTTAVAAEQTLYRLGPIQNTKAKKGKEKKKHIERGRKQVENLRADGLPLQAAAGRTVEMHKQLRFGLWSAPARAIPTGADAS